MSIHIPISQEAHEQLRKEKQKSTAVSLLLAIVIVLLIGACFAFLMIITPHQAQEVIISYNATTTQEDTSDEPKVQVRQSVIQPPASSSAAFNNVITTSSATSISIPDTEVMSSIDTPDFGMSDSFGMGFGFEESATNGLITAFGGAASTGMEGYIYDLKVKRPKSLDEEKELTKIGEIPFENMSFGRNIQLYQGLDDSIRRGKYSRKALKDYFVSPNSLNFNYLVIDAQNADIGPACFGAEKDIKPMAWVVVYEGVLDMTPAKPIRFSGRFDDILLVYVNDKIVFDGSHLAGYTDLFEEMEIHPHAPAMRGVPSGTLMSQYISLKEGDRMRIVVSEIPGGHLGGGLFVEEQGVENPGLAKDGIYRPIPFCTKELTEDDKEILSKKRSFPLSIEDIPIFKFKY